MGLLFKCKIIKDSNIKSNVKYNNKIVKIRVLIFYYIRKMYALIHF